MSVKNEVKRVLKHSSIYGVGNILHRLPPFILLPLYLNYLTPDDYGKKEIIALVIDFMGITLSMGIANAMARFYYDYQEEKDQNLVVSTIIISFAVIAGSVLLVIGFFAEPISGLVVDDRGDKYLIIMAMASLWFNSLYHMACNYLRIKEKSLYYVSISILKLTIQVSLNVWFIAGLRWGIYGIFASTLISAALFAFLLVVPLLYKIGCTYSHQVFRAILAFSAPMVISQLMASIVHMSDRYFVKAYVNIASAGIYTLGYRLGNSINAFVNSPFQKIWNPRKFAVHKQKDARDIYARILTYYCIVQGFAAVFLISCAKDLLLFVGKPTFYTAASIAPIITVSYVLFGIQNHFSTGIMIAKQTKYFMTINTANAGLNIILNFLLIPVYGMYGAAWATLICMAMKLVATFYFANRIYPVRWEYKRLVWITLSIAIACVACLLLNYTDLLARYLQDYELNRSIIRWLGLKYLLIHAMVGAAIYSVCLVIPGFLTPSESNTIKAKIRHITGRANMKFDRGFKN